MKNLLIALLLAILAPVSAFALFDLYPKNPNIDVINYIFKLDLSDSTDEIVGEATIDEVFDSTSGEFSTVEPITDIQFP